MHRKMFNSLQKNQNEQTDNCDKLNKTIGISGPDSFFKSKLILRNSICCMEYTLPTADSWYRKP